MSRSFAVTFDYRCPHARTIHEHLVLGLQAGGDWDVTFTPFCLHQAHVPEGGVDAWANPDTLPALTGLLAGLAVRDNQPEVFLPVHLALFTARHEQQLDLKDRDGVARVIDAAGGDGASALAEIDSGRPVKTLAEEHTAIVRERSVFGVPTFLAGDQSVFIRLMERPQGDGQLAIRTIERILDQIEGWPALNEYKHTTVPR